MSAVNYSKWDHIEVSDDEDDTHPNIDTASLFRWRHQARVQRMDEAAKEKQQLDEEMKKLLTGLEDAKQRAKAGDAAAAAQLAKLQEQEKQLNKKLEEFRKKEQKAPLNIDTICKEGKTRTIINKEKPKVEKSEEETLKDMQEFKKKHDKTVKEFGMLSKVADAQRFLEKHPELVCEAACDQLVLWCIDLAVEEKLSLLEHVSRQCISLQFLLRLGTELGTDPRNCLGKFYAKLQEASPQYMEAFEDELEAFRKRVKTRAQQRIDEAVREYEEEERQKRLGPGGLDPVEVFESLPPVLKECFESKDIGRLQEAIKSLPEEEARYHMRRCVDSGMWVPEAGGEGTLLQEEPPKDEYELD